MSLKTGCQEEGHSAHTGPHGEAPGQEAGEGRCGQEPLRGFWGEDLARAGSAVWGLLLVLWPLGARRGQGRSGLE